VKEIKYIFLFLSVFLAYSPESRAESQIAVIVHPQSRMTSIKKNDLVQIFLRKISQVTTGESISPRDQAAGDSKAVFYRHFFDSSLDEIHDYWIREVYRGGSRPPAWSQTKNDVEMRSYIASNPNTIGYIQRSFLNSSVKELSVE
jgi:ABC-type phosphate transport system substrate-binding protein